MSSHLPTLWNYKVSRVYTACIGMHGETFHRKLLMVTWIPVLISVPFLGYTVQLNVALLELYLKGH